MSEPKVSGWLYTDAQAFVDCPRCKSTAGDTCRRPNGRPAWPPHAERIGRLEQERPDVARASER